MTESEGNFMDFTVDGEVLKNGKRQWQSVTVHNVQTKDQAIQEAQSRVSGLNVLSVEQLEVDLEQLSNEYDLLEDDDVPEETDDSLDWKSDRGDFTD